MKPPDPSCFLLDLVVAAVAVAVVIAAATVVVVVEVIAGSDGGVHYDGP